METISAGCYGTLWSLDRSQKPEVFLRTAQIKWTTSLMVPKVARLWFYIEIYTRKDKYESRHPFKERTSKYKRRQQRCSTPEGRTMTTKDNSGNYNDKKKNKDRRKQHI